MKFICSPTMRSIYRHPTNDTHATFVPFTKLHVSPCYIYYIYHSPVFSPRPFEPSIIKIPSHHAFLLRFASQKYPSSDSWIPGTEQSAAAIVSRRINEVDQSLFSPSHLARICFFPPRIFPRGTRIINQIKQ